MKTMNDKTRPQSSTSGKNVHFRISDGEEASEKLVNQSWRWGQLGHTMFVLSLFQADTTLLESTGAYISVWKVDKQICYLFSYSHTKPTGILHLNIHWLLAGF